jgi:hypothetical protein
MFNLLFDDFEGRIRDSLNAAVTEHMDIARMDFQGAIEKVAEDRKKGLAIVAKERAKGLLEVEKERAKGLAEVEASRAELSREVAAMHTHKEAQDGHVELNIGGYRFQTTVQTLRRLPHTFFDAYFSGRYAQDVCNDGSIFVDRDGVHFGHILEFMRDGVVSVAEPGARPSISLLRALKREFGFYCIELTAEQPPVPEQLEATFAMGGTGPLDEIFSNMEQYDPSSGQWNEVASMITPRTHFSACAVAGELYVTGGTNDIEQCMSHVEKYSPSSNTWSAVASMPAGHRFHATVASGFSIYVLGGLTDNGRTTKSVLEYDSILGTWSAAADMPEARQSMAACAFGNDVYVFGGYDENGQEEESVFKFDTQTKVWSILAPMPLHSAVHSASVLDGLVYIAGAGQTHKVVMVYDPASEVWILRAPKPLMNRTGCSSFVLGGSLYIAGGEGAGMPSSVQRYDVTNNAWIAAADMLTGRSYFGAVTILPAGPIEEEDLFDSLIAQALA